MKEATVLLLNEEAFLQQDTALVGPHLVLCNENQKETSAYWLSTEGLQLHPLDQEAGKNTEGE